MKKGSKIAIGAGAVGMIAVVGWILWRNRYKIPTQTQTQTQTTWTGPTAGGYTGAQLAQEPLVENPVNPSAIPGMIQEGILPTGTTSASYTEYGNTGVIAGISPSSGVTPSGQPTDCWEPTVGWVPCAPSTKRSGGGGLGVRYT